VQHCTTAKEDLSLAGALTAMNYGAACAWRLGIQFSDHEDQEESRWLVPAASGDEIAVRQPETACIQAETSPTS